MKIKVYIEGIPKGAKCRRGKVVCKWYYSPASMCALFVQPVRAYFKCEKCEMAEEVF